MARARVSAGDFQGGAGVGAMGGLSSRRLCETVVRGIEDSARDRRSATLGGADHSGCVSELEAAGRNRVRAGQSTVFLSCRGGGARGAGKEWAEAHRKGLRAKQCHLFSDAKPATEH